MSLVMVAMSVILFLLIVFAICVAIRDETQKFRSFDAQARRLLRQIDSEAQKKGVSAEPVILNALRRIINDLRSL